MATVRAVVLAAGRGVRMGGRHPKTLLPLEDEEPILAHILSGLGAAGIADLAVVTGFMAEDVQEFVAARAGGMPATFMFNPRYASWGNFHSVRIALDQSPGRPVLVVNSDVVVAPDVYGAVASAAGDLALAVVRRPRLDEEDMRVRLRGERVVGIGKDLRMALSHGEFAGVSLVRPDAARLYAQAATALEWTGGTGAYYEDVYGRILGSVDARAVVVDARDYAEVDNPDDVAAAAAVARRHAARS